MRIAKLRLCNLIGQVLQEVLCCLRRHADDLFGFTFVEPHSFGSGLGMGAH